MLSMDINQIRKGNLQALVGSHKSQREFADAVDTAPAYISQILTKTKTPTGKERGVGDELARKVEERLKLPRGWMDVQHEGTGLGDILKAKMTEHAGNENVSVGPEIKGKVPLISWVQAGAFTDAVDLLHPGEAYEWINSTVQPQEHTFALRVKGDSMEPLFPPGIILIVEPGLEAHEGSYVIVKNGEEEATFKQLVKDGSDWYLKPLNPRYPIKPFSSGHIVGVVRAAQLTFA